MKLHFKRTNDLIFIDKPAGFSTHSPDKGKLGLCEIYEKELQTKLYIVQRLDKTTTGSIVFATSAARAAELTELFQTRQVEKKYLFVTDRKSSKENLNNQNPVDGKSAATEFRRLKQFGSFELWQALPETGRAHQIRIHASELGLPILGDETYGGTAFPHLCLHAKELKLPGEEAFISEAPIFFEQLDLLKDSTLVHWLSEVDRRQRLYNFTLFPSDCLRLIHLPELRLDLFGSQLWFYWYFENSPGEADLARCEFVAKLLEKNWLLRKMQNRGEDPNARKVWNSDKWQTSWTAFENGLEYQFHSEAGQSPGLFLDQRANREALKTSSQGQKGLNLFSYTCGFSVSAAAGGAQQVTSVDLSGPFLEWGRQNFNLNKMDSSKYEFYQQESLLYLKGALKRNRVFDFIVCDPPSFGRHKNGVFRLDHALPDLLKMCWQCLAPGGKMLLSCNLEKWSLLEFRDKIQRTLPSARIEPGLQGWDFEVPNEDPLMKSFWIHKRK